MVEEASDFVYRLRPMKDYTLDELRYHYLWFSTRRGFKDTNDANIGRFIDQNPLLLKSLRLHFNDSGINELINKMDDTGICCFTKSIPTRKCRRHFPNGNNSICIKYNKVKIEKALNESKYAIYNPFHDIHYEKDPFKLETDGDFHIAISKNSNEIQYIPICNLCDKHELEKVIYFLLTNLDYQFAIQNETRIIMGGRNLCYLDRIKNGYKVLIPEDAIEEVILYDKKKEFIKCLCDISHISNKIKFYAATTTRSNAPKR